MNKFLTVATCLFALSAFNAQADTPIQWGISFTSTPDEVYTLPSYEGNIYIVTDSQTDLTAEEDYAGQLWTNSVTILFYFSTEWNEWSGTYYSNLTTSEGGFYVYSYEDLSSDESYALKWDGDPVQFTVYQGDYEDGDVGGGTTDPERNIIKFNEKFTAGPAAQIWYYEGKDDYESFYFKSTSEEDLLSNGTLEWWYSNYGLEMKLDLNAVLTDDGTYVYTNQTSISDNTYYLKYTGETEVNFTMIAGEYVESGKIELGKTFTASPEKSVWKLTDFTTDDDYYLETNSSNNYKTTNSSELSLSIQGSNMLTNWAAVQNSETGFYAYNGHINVDNGTLTIVYGGTEPIELTLNLGTYTQEGAAEYMDYAQQTPNTVPVSDLSAAIELTWGETVTIVDDSATMSYTFNGDSQPSIIEAKDYLQFKNGNSNETGISTLSVENGDSGTTLLFLFGGALGNNLQVGEYVFTLPAGIVQNEDGKLNPKQEITVNVVGSAEGELSPEDGTEYNEGDEVEFTITFESAPEINEESIYDYPVFITDYQVEEGYETGLDWEAGVVYIEDNSVVINFGSELAPATYHVTFYDGAVTVDGTPNDMLEFTFTVLSSEEAPSYLETPATITPDPRADSVEPFSQITVSWEGYTIRLNGECQDNATFNDEIVEPTLADNALVFVVSAEEDGSYTLNIPKDFIIATDEEGNEYYNENITPVFIVEATDNGDGDDEGDGGDNGDDEGDDEGDGDDNNGGDNGDDEGDDEGDGDDNNGGDNGDDEGDGDDNNGGNDQPGNTPGGDDNNGGNDQPGNTPEDPGTSGIAGVTADSNGLFKVYNYNGVNVMTTNDPKNLQSLKGMFIINGKKVVIK